MNKSLLSIFVLIAVAFSACNNHTTEKVKKEYTPLELTVEQPTHITMDDSTREALIKRGKWLSRQVKYALKTELHKSVKANGLEGTIDFCNERAFQITDSISRAHQIMVKRAALKNRNPLNAMDEFETKVYKNFVISWINKGPIHGKILINDLNQPVYYNVMTMKKFCLNCHGSSEQINPEVAKRIKELYPEDRAVDFTIMQPRGMWKITFPEYYVEQ